MNKQVERKIKFGLIKVGSQVHIEGMGKDTFLSVVGITDTAVQVVPTEFSLFGLGIKTFNIDRVNVIRG